MTGATVQEPKSIVRAVTKFKTFNFERRTHTRYSMPMCHFDSFNLWLLKPTHLNRGRGIHVFRDMDSLIKLIKQYCSGKEEVNIKRKQTTKEAEETKGNEEQIDQATPTEIDPAPDSDGDMSPAF